MHRGILLGYGAALSSAALVGLFTVLNKWLLTEHVPALTAGALTYLAAGLALLPWAVRAGRLHAGDGKLSARTGESLVPAGDTQGLAGGLRGLAGVLRDLAGVLRDLAGVLRVRRPAVLVLWLLTGSVFGPALYFVGLKLTSGVQGVLMINMEAVFTALLAFLVFRERLTLPAAAASLAVLAGGVWLSWPASGASMLTGGALGNLLISLGYLGWGTENNLGRLLGEEIPTVTLVCLKALVAALAMGGLALAFGQPLTVPLRVVPGIAASGALSLGLSLALFYKAMGQIGAGRTGLISSTATLWGILGALLLLGESLNARVVPGGLLMLLGLAFFALESARSASAVPDEPSARGV